MTVLLANAPTRVPTEVGRELFYVKAGSRWPFSVEKRPSEICRYVPFPFSLAYLAALLERERISVDVIDAVALNLPEEEFIARAAASKPSLIVMEATTPTNRARCRARREAQGGDEGHDRADGRPHDGLSARDPSLSTIGGLDPHRGV